MFQTHQHFQNLVVKKHGERNLKALNVLADPATVEKE
jgi:hypothetical protein